MRGRRIGEVVSVSTTRIVAQSYQLDDAPAFGSLVLIPGTSTHYALCYAVETGSIEPGRHAVAWGSADESSDDIYQRQPQLSQILRTTFEALLVGTEHEGRLVQRIPSRPPRLHAAVYEAPAEEVSLFNDDLQYLRLLVRSELPTVDDLLAATIDQACRARGHDRDYLLEAARMVARLLEPAHERVMNVLELLDD